jgi:hypothetical protein
VVVIKTPGAKRSKISAELEGAQTLSISSVAPTEIALDKHAGKLIPLALLSLPEAINVAIP